MPLYVITLAFNPPDTRTLPLGTQRKGDANQALKAAECSRSGTLRGLTRGSYRLIATEQSPFHKG